MCNQKGAEKKSETLDEDALPEDFPLTEETTCGFGPFRSSALQKFANKKVFVGLYGLLGCVYGATYAYFNGTITTIEKRFKIPSRTTGIISVGNDISILLGSMVLSYYFGRGHRPRWIAFGLYTIVLFCVLNAMPHLLYGPGNDALALTLEYGDGVQDFNDTQELKEKGKLCNVEGGVGCEVMEGSFAPQVILFSSNFIAGIGGSLYYTLGTSYMDDNIKRAKTPMLMSLSYFLRMLGPPIGYSLASVSLKTYISPTLTPLISTKDPRWLGAWWIGWLVLALVLAMFGFLIGLFPKQLPRAAYRKMLEKEQRKQAAGEKVIEEEAVERPSIVDMMRTFRRLITNKTLMYNTFAAVFYFFGYSPYWMFMPKYIETQYHQSASTSSLITGTVGILFSAIGVLVAGFVLSSWKPRARILAAWNVFVSLVNVVGISSYIFLGCSSSDQAIRSIISHTEDMSCRSDCHCDYVTYSPVCTLDDSTTYISACHAGCKASLSLDNGTMLYTDCSCVPGNNGTFGIVRRGFCPVDCFQAFITFLCIVCTLKFVGATGRASNFLVSVRCVEEKDKATSMAFGMTIMSLLSFIPAPIFFGFLIDKTCLVWGKTCSGTGSCWLYNGEALRLLMNSTAACLILVGTLFDVMVWYHVKDLNIFDAKVKPEEVEESHKLEERRPSHVD